MQLRRRAVLISGMTLIIAAIVGTVAVAVPQVMNMTTHLSTADEVPEPDFELIDRNPQGEAVLKLSHDGELTYKLNVTNIENVMMAHIHLGPPGAAGPIVVWLYPDSPPAQLIEGRFNGTLAAGTITDDDVLAPEGFEHVQTVADLLDEVRAGNAYVNVHTEQNPSGEIRGQVPEDRGPATHSH